MSASASRARSLSRQCSQGSQGSQGSQLADQRAGCMRAKQQTMIVHVVMLFSAAGYIPEVPLIRHEKRCAPPYSPRCGGSGARHLVPNSSRSRSRSWRASELAPCDGRRARVASSFLACIYARPRRKRRARRPTGLPRVPAPQPLVPVRAEVDWHERCVYTTYCLSWVVQ